MIVVFRVFLYWVQTIFKVWNTSQQENCQVDRKPFARSHRRPGCDFRMGKLSDSLLKVSDTAFST